MLGADLAGEVSTDATYVVEPEGPQRFTVAAIDLGIKTNTPRNFARRGIRSHVLPASATYEQIADLKPDGVFLSNGPGDPATADHVVGRHPGGTRRGHPAVRHLLRQPDPRPRARAIDVQDGVRPPRDQRAGDRPPDRPASRSPRRITGSRSRVRQESASIPRSARRSSATPVPTTASSRASNLSAGLPFRCSITLRPRRDRMTRTTCSTSSST